MYKGDVTMGKKEAAQVKPTIWWVDDDFNEPERNTRLLNQLKRSRKFSVEGITPQHFRQTFENEKHFPDLFIIDYKLNDLPDSEGVTFPYQGTSLVGVIRDKCPELPIYLVSRLLNDDNTALTHDRDDLFDRLIPWTWLSEKKQKKIKDILFYDALDYRLVRDANYRKSIHGIHRLLKTPDNSKELVEEVIPNIFNNGIGKIQNQFTYNLSGPIWFAEWVRTEFMRLHGLLYDDLHAATLLGVSKDYFISTFSNKLKKIEGTLYEGVYHKTYPRRWWKLSLLEFVQSKNSKNLIGEPCEVTHKIFKIDKANYSKCIVCGEYFPETVGFDCDDSTVRGPVHWRCSEGSQERTVHPLYEQTRIYELG